MKKIFKYVSEITLAVILIFVSYFAWNRIDVEAYETFITQYTLEDISVSVDNSFNQLVYLSDESSIEGSILSVNNYQDKKYNANILLELDGINNNIVNNLILVVDNNRYNLNDIYTYNNDNKYYFLITNVSLNEYEKKNYYVKLLVNDNYEFSDYSNLSYNIIEEIV